MKEPENKVFGQSKPIIFINEESLEASGNSNSPKISKCDLKQRLMRSHDVHNLRNLKNIHGSFSAK